MPPDLRDKVIVITGAAGGLGEATARRFAAEGSRVVGVDIAEHAIGDLALRANLTTAFLCCKHGIPHLLDSEPAGGSVINTASFLSIMGAATSQMSYAAAKAGVLALTRDLGVNLARRGVRVNALCLGPVQTPALRPPVRRRPAEVQRRVAHLPMGRFGTADEVAGTVAWLASADSGFVTATGIPVDGGITAAYTVPSEPPLGYRRQGGEPSARPRRPRGTDARGAMGRSPVRAGPRLAARAAGARAPHLRGSDRRRTRAPSVSPRRAGVHRLAAAPRRA